MPPDAVARSVAHLPQRKIWQRYAFPFNPVKLSLFALAYLVACGYGSLFLQTASAALWFPDSVLLCALLLTPPNEWWLYLAIAVPIRLIPTPYPPIPLWFVFATSANDLIKATFAAYLLRRLPNGSSHPSTMPQLGTFLGVGVFVVPVLSAFAGAATRHLLGYGFWVSWYQWFLGDALANVVLTPALLYWSSKRFRALRPRTAELGLWIAGFALSLMLALTLAHSAYSPIAVCVPVPFLIWAATRFGLIGASTSLSVIALLGTARIAEKTALFSMGFESKSLIFLQLFLFVVSIPVLCIATVIEEKDSVEKTLQSREELLEIFVKNVPAAVAMLDRDMRYLQVSDRWCTDYLRGRAQSLGRSHYEMFPDMPERWKEVHRRSLQGETLRADEDRWDGQDGPHWARWEVRPWKTSEGTVGGILILAEDITRRKQMEESLRESEDELRLLLDSTAEALYGIDLEHRCTFVNAACLRTLGYEQVDEVLGKNMHNLIHHTRADGTSFPAEECGVLRVTRTGEGVHAEDEMFWRANGTCFPVEYWSYPQRRGQEVVGAVVAFIDITERKLAEIALANLSHRLIEAQEQERTRIGRELHDDIVQRLALLAINLQQLQKSPDLPPEVRSHTGELWEQTTGIATDLQHLSHELHSSKLQYLGLAVAMRGFCREFGEQQNVEIDFQTHDLPSPLSADISLCFFRVLQEALHNSAKHSGARHFEVRLWGTSDELHLTVRDSGAGFDLEAAKESRGVGLISMEERLKLVRGSFSIESQPKRGTTIHARVPVCSGSDSMRIAG